MQKVDLKQIGSREYAREVAQSWDRLLGDYTVETPVGTGLVLAL